MGLCLQYYRNVFTIAVECLSRYQKKVQGVSFRTTAKFLVCEALQHLPPGRSCHQRALNGQPEETGVLPRDDLHSLRHCEPLGGRWPAVVQQFPGVEELTAALTPFQVRTRPSMIRGLPRGSSASCGVVFPRAHPVPGQGSIPLPLWGCYRCGSRPACQWNV